MQQRYYDPIAGRFLSVDPVTTDAATGKGFGRYHYANNNPYAFTDPTGMDPECGIRCMAMRAASDAHSLGQSTIGAIDSVMTGGYGASFSQAASAGNWGQAGVNFGAAMAYGAANLATFGEGGAVVGVAKAAAAKGGGEITTLLHGSDLASVQAMVANGIDKTAARALGGGDVFWATTDKAVAALFASANPAGGTPAVAAFKIPTSALESLMKSGAVAVDRTGAYMVENWKAFNKAVIQRVME